MMLSDLVLAGVAVVLFAPVAAFCWWIGGVLGGCIWRVPSSDTRAATRQRGEKEALSKT